MKMLNKYSVHFEVDEDIEVSVIIATEQTEEMVIIDYAEKKLEQGGLSIIVDHYKGTTVDLLETLG
jgi:hypothetical protein